MLTGLVPLEILYVALVFFGGGSRLEGTEVSPLPGLWIYFPRIEPVFA
jgi:hypothetical protein